MESSNIIDFDHMMAYRKYRILSYLIMLYYNALYHIISHYIISHYLTRQVNYSGEVIDTNLLGRILWRAAFTNLKRRCMEDFTEKRGEENKM